MDVAKDLISQYGYFAIYGLLALGIIGLPVPDEVMMTFVGYLSSTSILDLKMAVFVSFLGSMTGMLMSYFIGHKMGISFLEKYGKWVRLTPARLYRAERWFRRYGPWMIPIAYFIPGIRHVSSYLSGISGMNKRVYLKFASAGAIFWCLFFILFGYFIGVM